MQLWEKKTKEELETIILNSKTKTEALQKIGYIGAGHTKIINTISQKYNINIKHLEKQSIIKKKFGKLTVIDKTEYRDSQRNILYYCLCECGNYTLASGVELKRNRILSCGCLSSKGEAKINQLLSQMSISFFTQKTFPDLIGIGGGKLKFDFYFNYQGNTFVIEYQGQQHYKSSDYFGGEQQFAWQQANDNLKREYCQNNGIKLIEIPYFEYENINIDYLKEKLK